MKSYTKFFIFSILVVCLMFAYQNCSNVRLEKADANSYSLSSSSIDLCTQKASEIKSALKFIFVVDRSGSNQRRYDANGVALPGTDPDGNRRFVALENFIQQFQTDPYIYWSMINFGTNAGVAKSFTNDKQNFYNFVVDQHARTQQIDTDGWTNYLGALDSAQKLISDDIAAAALKTPIVSSNYVIIFISDGAPIVSTGMQDQSLILKKVQTISALRDNQPELIEGINFNTGFYYSDATPDYIAKTLLQQMANQAHGDALEFGQGQAIDFNRFAIPTRIQRFELREIWIQNMNTVWWNGKLMLDSDEDGLPDEVEITLGSDPYRADSDGNGVSDGVEYRLSGKPCKDSKCSAAGADPYLKCASIVKTTTSPITYPDTDNDGLNDCEEALLGSDYRLFDTNLDYVPDGFAFSRGVEFLKGSNDLLLDPDQDGVTNYYELKYNTPVNTRNSSVPGIENLTLTMNKTSEDASQTCYHFNIDHLVTMGTLSTANHIRVYELESTSIIGTKRIMRRADKSTVIFGNLQFSTADFK